MDRKGNEDCIIIAEYMGATVIEQENGRVVFDFPKRSGYDYWLDYKTSWDWLMPVLSKIEDKGCIVDLGMTSLGCVASISLVNEDVFFNNKSNILIEATYKSVVQYIKWVNKNKIKQ